MSIHYVRRIPAVSRLAGWLLFTLALAPAGLADTLEALIFWRLVQAVGLSLAVAGKPRPVDERDDATVAVSALAAAAGAWCVRVHDARGNVDAVRVAAAWDKGHL